MNDYVRENGYKFVRSTSATGPNIQIPYSTAHIENYDYLVLPIYWLYHETPLYSAGLGGNPVKIYNYKFEEVDINATNIYLLLADKPSMADLTTSPVISLAER